MAHHPLPANVHQFIVDLLDGGRAFALVTLLKDAGSTPRKAGTRMTVEAGGETWGTIGGGLLESEARRVAEESLRSGKASAFDFRFAGATARGDDPVCGGAVRVLVDPAPAGHADAFAAAAEAVRSRRRGALLTYVRGGPHVEVRWCPIPADASPVHPVDYSLRTGRATHVETAGTVPEQRVEFLVEPVIPAPLLLVAGGGHVGQALARQAVLVGFEVAVVEDREEFADASLYPPGVQVHRGRFAELVKQWPLDADTYVAIVGRGHKVDGEALAAVIDKPVRYVGMMGSRRKVVLMRREFLEAGVATAEQLDRVHAPIGLDVGAETVEEIAASIVAELVAALRGRRVRG